LRCVIDEANSKIKIITTTIEVPTILTTNHEPDPHNIPCEDRDASLRLDFIRNITREAWEAYAQYAWGQDVLRPLSRTREDKYANGHTIIGAMSTLWLMGLREEYTRAREWVLTKMDINKVVDDGLWDVPGALLSCYALTGDQELRDKALRVFELFSTPGKWQRFKFNPTITFVYT